MRRSDREVTDFNEIIEIMKRCDVCRLALNDAEYPYILPLNFGMEVQDGRITLYFHGAMEGTKYELIARNNKAAFEMDCSHRLVTDDKNMSCTMEYESVIGHGIVEYVTDDDKYDALCLIMKQYHQEDFPFSTKVIPNTKVFKLTVTDFTAKKRMKH